MSEYKWPLMQDTISWGDKIGLVKHILTTSSYTQGKKVLEFEKAWSDWLGAKHSLFVTSGSTANFLLVASVIEKYGLKPGDKVLLPACTWMTNVAPIMQLGLTPVFCDINLHDYSFDETSLRLIQKHHTDIKLVFVTHLLGIPADYSIVEELYPKAIILDDVCESHGCFDKVGKKIGSNSLGATFSFYFGHHMTSIEGGMISTNDSELYDLMRMKRSHGLARNSVNYDLYSKENPDIDRSFLFVTDGYNFRNTELGAVLGLSQLKRLNESIRIRRRNYAWFADIVNSSDKFYPIDFNFGNSCFCFPLICKTLEQKNKLLKLLGENKIEYRPVVSGNLLRQPFLKNRNDIIRVANYPNADLIHYNGVYIGNNQFVTKNNLLLLAQIVGEL
jgi:CDP-4-dehydro-6-deoxyglucose reductase, E1